MLEKSDGPLRVAMFIEQWNKPIPSLTQTRCVCLDGRSVRGSIGLESVTCVPGIHPITRHKTEGCTTQDFV